MHHINDDNTTLIGTLSGTLLSILASGNIMTTIFLAALGATISFFVTMAWKKIFKKNKDEE